MSSLRVSHILPCRSELPFLLQEKQIVLSRVSLRRTHRDYLLPCWKKINSSKLTIRFHRGALSESPAVLRSCGIWGFELFYRWLRFGNAVSTIWKAEPESFTSQTNWSDGFLLAFRNTADTLWKVNLRFVIHSFECKGQTIKFIANLGILIEKITRQCIHLFLLHTESALN